MAFLKKIKFGESTNNIAKTIVNGAPEGVIAVTNTSTYQNTDSEDKDYSYDIDVRVDNATIVKDGETNKVLKVGTVPAAQVGVAAGAGIEATNAQAAFKELKDDIDAVGGAAKSYEIIKETTGLETNVKEQYKLQETVGSTTKTVGETIKIYKDSSLKSVALVDQELVFTYILEDGSESVARVDVSKFLTESKDGLAVNASGEVSAKLGQGLEFDSESGENKPIKVKIDSTSETFLTVGADGVKLAGVQDAINAKVAALDFTSDAAVAGQYVAAIEETDGIVAVKTRANVSEAVLNNYAKGSDATAVAATDTINKAISKLENQVDAAKTAATTKVVEGTDEGNNMTIASATSETDGSTTYTINLTDVASKTDLNAEIAARKAVDGQDGQTYAANANTNYISGATSLNDADVKLDAAIKAEETRANSAETAIDSVVGLTKAASGEGRTYTNTGNYIGKGDTNTVASDIKALDTQLKTVTDKVGEIQYKVNGTTLEFYGMTAHA